MTQYIIKIKQEDVDPSIDEEKQIPLDLLFRKYSHLAKFEGTEHIEGDIYLIHVFTDMMSAFNFGKDLMKERYEVISETRKDEVNVSS